MGRGIALQVGKTPGMELVWVSDLNLQAAKQAAEMGGCELVGEDVVKMLQQSPIDVFVEATNSIAAAADYCVAAMDQGAHVVLMNAEVDLALGVYLKNYGEERGLVVTSDAGDQHGVLATMIEEIRLWGFDIVQAGNIKGFLNRYATVESLAHEAAIRELNVNQCCAYTDGTKLHIEMAVLANGYGYLPPEGGMTGPRVDKVEEAMSSFDFDSYNDQGRIDYILGAEPGGGVYVVGKCDWPDQKHYLWYYKLGDGPYYLFYRPYHLCHLETTRAIAQVHFHREAVLQAWHGRVTDVYAYAKMDLKAGMEMNHAIGSDEIYGLAEPCERGDVAGQVPVCVVDSKEPWVLTKDIAKDTPLTWGHFKIPSSNLVDRFKTQLSS